MKQKLTRNVIILILLIGCFYQLNVYAYRTSTTPLNQSPRVRLSEQPSPQAYGNFDGTITFVTNYLSYGISNSNNLPALQGEIYYTIPSGFSIGIWGSNTIINRWKQSLELYPSLSWQGKYKNWTNFLLVAYDSYYIRPHNVKSPNYFEFQGASSYSFKYLNVGLSLNFSPNFYGNSGQFYMPAVTFTFKLPHQYKYHFQYGYNFIQKNQVYGVPDYSFIETGLSKENIFRWLNVGVFFYDTTVKKSQCFPRSSTLGPVVNTCGPGAFMTLSHHFS